MNAHKSVPNQSHGFRYAYTGLGLVLGVALGSLLYFVTGELAYLAITVAFGLVSGAGVDQGYEGREYTGDNPFK